MNHLYLIRHGENRANLTLEFSHRMIDYTLTPKGILQAQQTAEALAHLGIDEIYASPLKRAFETAQIIGEKVHRPVTVMEAFREVNVGELEGQKPTIALWDLHNKILKAWADGQPDLSFPGGENLHMLRERMRQGLTEVLAGKDNQRIAIIAHGGIFTITLPDWCASMDSSILEQGMGNCSITEVLAQLKDGQIQARMLQYNSTAHLHGEAADLISGVLRYPDENMQDAENSTLTD